jgi:hypothetical protein
MAGATAQLSVAVALPVFPGSVLAEHEIVTLAGQTTEGAELSTKMIV